MANRSIEIKAHYKDTKATIALTIVKYLPRLCEYLKKKKKKKKKNWFFNPLCMDEIFRRYLCTGCTLMNLLLSSIDPF